MERGLARLPAWFEGYSDQFVLIGGTAACCGLAKVQPSRKGEVVS